MLYSKSHLVVRHAASTDPARYNLNGVHFKSDGVTEATDGHILIRAKVIPYPTEEFPEIPDMAEQNGEELQAFICPLETVEQVRKAIPKARKSLPILGNAILDVVDANSNGRVRFFTTDLESHQAVTGKKIEGEYPNTDRVFPKLEEDAKPTFALDLCLMERLIKAAKEFGATAKGTCPARFYVTDALTAIQVNVNNPDVGELEMLIMPMRV